MIAPRLVKLIETHSEHLGKGLIERLKASKKLTQLWKVPEEEIRERAEEVYHNLGAWLLARTESDIEKQYIPIGSRRAAQGVPLSQMLYAIVLTEEYLWEYLVREGMVDLQVELFQELELLRLVNQFFDRALYYVAVGYERAAAARAA